MQVVKEVTLLFKTDFYVPVPFTELKIWEHQVRYEVDRRRREIGALGRFQTPYPPFPHHPIPNQFWTHAPYEMFTDYCNVEGT